MHAAAAADAVAAVEHTQFEKDATFENNKSNGVSANSECQKFGDRKRGADDHFLVFPTEPDRSVTNQ